MQFSCFLLITDRVRSTTGRLCFDTCLSIHPSVCPHLGGGVPRPGPGRGGYPSQVQLGGTPAGGVPGGIQPRVPPLSDLAGGYPNRGVPHLGYPPLHLAGGTLTREVPTLGNPPVDLAWGTLTGGGGTPPRVPPSDLAGRVPHLG